MVNYEVELVSAGLNDNDMSFPTIDFGSEDLLGGLKKHKVEEIKPIELNNTTSCDI